MLKAIGYIRVSTEEQVQEGISLDMQRERITNFCKAKSLDLVKIYADRGKSAKNLKRDGIQQLLQDIKTEPVKAVVVYKLDRLTRRLSDLLYLIEKELTPKGIDLLAVVESFDTSTAFGKAMLQILGVFAELERNTIAERTRHAINHKQSNGEKVGRAPYGYRYKDKALIPDPQELAVVKRIFQLREDSDNGKRLSLHTIAKRLNQEGIASPYNHKWHASTVMRILANPIYAGIKG